MPCINSGAVTVLEWSGDGSGKVTVLSPHLSLAIPAISTCFFTSAILSHSILYSNYCSIVL